LKEHDRSRRHERIVFTAKRRKRLVHFDLSILDLRLLSRIFVFEIDLAFDHDINSLGEKVVALELMNIRFIE
jgi:hypothetical protein